MDIQYNNKEFKLVFYQQGVNPQITKFFINEDDIYINNPCIVLKENIKVEVLFSSNCELVRLYMDGLETLPEKMVEEDEVGEIYRKPSEDSFELFINNYYPLIPGYYRIKVMVNEISYYALLKIIPKLLTENQLEIMKEELEEELTGLAQQFIRKNLGIGNLFDKAIAPKELYRFMIIRKRFSNVIASLLDLTKRANHNICKDYIMVSKDQAKKVDSITIRHYLIHGEKRNLFKIPIRKINYNLPENQWIKRITRIITKYLDEFIKSNDRFRTEEIKKIDELKPFEGQTSTYFVIREHKRVLSYLDDSSKMANMMKNAINILKESEWYREIPEYRGTYVPHVLLSDSRYSILYKLYRELQSETFEIEIDDKYTLQWKRTDNLYEMWGYIKIYKALCSNKLGFNVLKGWIFDKDFNEKRVLIPTLTSGTRIILEKDNVKLSLVYDDVMPFTSNNTSITEQPLYMQGIHNRPDGRIDVYKENIYIGSLLFDFKYRKKYSFWKKSLANSSKKPKVMNQLISYQSQCKSPYLFGSTDKRKYISDMNPVYKVLAIYPMDESKSVVQNEKDYELQFVKLKPGKSEEHLEEVLLNNINDIIERASLFIG